jgi:predicted enzyme related to lactoylglutathione lyase
MVNLINWFEIPANDIDRAVKFYNEVLNSLNTAAGNDGNKDGFL